jgi:hypothetical protein
MSTQLRNDAYRERQGYEVNYATPRAVKSVDRISFWKRIKTEELLGTLIFWGGICWAVQILTKDIANMFRLLLTPGPLEVCGVGLLVWIHAKWRRSVKVV